VPKPSKLTSNNIILKTSTTNNSQNFLTHHGEVLGIFYFIMGTHVLLGSTDFDKNWKVGSFWCVDKELIRILKKSQNCRVTGAQSSEDRKYDRKRNEKASKFCVLHQRWVA
jgi:hypothetical protein